MRQQGKRQLPKIKQRSKLMSGIDNHSRITSTILSVIEKPLLKWLVARLPARVTPDMLTAFGLFGAVLAGLGYYLSNFSNYFLWLSSFGLFINWYGDSLDGTLARYRHIEKPLYGFFIDHSMDSVTMVLIGIGAGLSPYARFDLALFALVAYLLMSILVYLNTHVSGVFKISFYGFGPTEVRLFIVAINTVIFFLGAGSFHFKGLDLTYLDAAAIFLAILLFVLYFVSVLVEGNRLKKMERENKQD
jgi:archaetidylinositol phosphate synthase